MNWIGAQWVDSGKRSLSFDPATGKTIGTYADADSATAEAAIEVAFDAFQKLDWRDNRQLRARVLNQIADRFEARR